MTEQNKRIVELMKQTGVVDEKLLQERLKKAYYETSEPIITDEEYDELFGDKDYVGCTPDQNGPWEVLEHKIAMGSLEKLKTWDQALKWIQDKGDIIWQPKLDGLSIELVYEYGKLTHAILRGGGDKGEDIFKNAISFKNTLPIINSNLSYVSIRGEVVISQSMFDELNKLSNNAYKNRRNCISGICRRYDGLYSNLLSFYAYDIIEENEEYKRVYRTYTEKLKAIREYGFVLPFMYTQMTEERYKDCGDIRDTAEDYQMDGLVLKTDDLKYQIALKFEPKGERTKVTGYSWEIGSTGKYVPKILFEKVNVGGSNLTQAAMGSFQGYLDFNAPVGSIIEVRKMGDVIPKAVKVIHRAEGALLGIPYKCPHCGTHLLRHGADLYCDNPDCIIKQIDKCCFVYHPVALKGVKEGWIKELMKQGKITKCYDVPLTKPEDIASLEGYSMNTAVKLTNHIRGEYQKMYDTDDLKWFLCMLPIPTISGKALDILSQMFKTSVNTRSIDNFRTFIGHLSSSDLALLKEKLKNAKGTKAYEYFRDNRDDILELIRVIERIASIN